MEAYSPEYYKALVEAQRQRNEKIDAALDKMIANLLSLKETNCVCCNCNKKCKNKRR